MSTVVPHLGGLVAPPQQKEGPKELENAASSTPTNEAPAASKGKFPPAKHPSKGKSPPPKDPSKGKSPPAKDPSKGKSPHPKDSSKGKSPPPKGNSGVPHPSDLGEAKGKLKPTQVSGSVPVAEDCATHTAPAHCSHQLKVISNSRMCMRVCVNVSTSYFATLHPWLPQTVVRNQPVVGDTTNPNPKPKPLPDPWYTSIKDEEEKKEFFDTPEEAEQKVKQVAEYMRSSRYTIMFTGAGISTRCVSAASCILSCDCHMATMQCKTISETSTHQVITTFPCYYHIFSLGPTHSPLVAPTALASLTSAVGWGPSLRQVQECGR